jgi:ATP phosphoribosyltransferase regulatory subunit
MDNAHWLLPEGIDEILPPKATELERLRRKLLDLYHSWGYELISPPFIEYIESLLTGTGGDLDLQTFKLTDQITGRTLGVRADITPQAARIDAHQLRSESPTRLCYIGTVLNTRSDGFASSRSPLQIGAELYGHAGVESDLEILCLMLETLESAGIGDLYLDLGHVGIFRSLAQQAGLSNAQEMALFDALQRKAVPELDQLVAGFGLDQEIGAMLIALAELNGDDAINRASECLRGASQEVLKALAELEQLAGQLAARRPEIPIHFDLGELRGYHYHTGVVFAAFVPGLGQEVARGGRYDDIGNLFGRARPARGFSADLKLLFGLKSRKSEEDCAIMAPATGEAGLIEKVKRLRSEGRRVIFELPGQSGDARSMNCGEVLEYQNGDWIVKAID